MSREEVINVVKASNLRGRGGAGFPTGLKWSFIPKNAADTYVLINTDESETGTFKDRELIERNPHQVIEGALIAAYAVNSRLVFNYIRGEYMDAAWAFEEALRSAAPPASSAAASWAATSISSSTPTTARGPTSAAKRRH
jgi:NADH-quinone oxidoreductase subunit F